MTYLPRAADKELDSLLAMAPAVAIDGAKGVGKTATAMRRAQAAWQLDYSDELDLLRADPQFRDAPPGTLVIDEWQRFLPVWDLVRRQVDAGAAPGRFLLTGSAWPRAGVDTHSGAGRILSLRMRPMALFERGVVEPSVSLRGLLTGDAGRLAGATDWSAARYFQEITASGFPGIRTRPEALRESMLNAYLQRVVDRDVAELGVTLRHPVGLTRWLAAYASASSTTTAYSKLLDLTTAGDGRQPAKTTTIAYRELLTKLWLLDPVPGWSHSRNPMTRLQQAPKHQLADPALAARLLNLSASALGRPVGAAMAGRLFESLATLSVRVAAQVAGARVGHLRTGNGDREVDLVVEDNAGRVVGVEVKLAAAVGDADVKHLLWLRDKLPDDVVDLVVVTTGTRAYRRADGVAVVPLALLGP